jgi:hypothetical protein
MIKPAGRRQKGGRLERKVAELLRQSGLDVKAKRSFQSGAQWAWKSDIYTDLEFALECKNQEKVKIWDFWEQAESQRKPFKDPVLMITSNYRPILAVMKIEDWINLVKKSREK